VDQEYIPEAWRTVTSEGDNLYKFLDPSKFPMEMVSEALQFWYEHQEKGKVAFHFKSFLEGKGVWEALPRKKIKVHTVGKGKRSKGPRKGWAETESRSDDEARLRNKGKPGRSMGQRKGWAETESRSDDEVQSNDEDQVYTVGRGKLGKSKGQRKGGETWSDEEAWPRRKAVKDPEFNDTDNDSWDSDHRPIKERSQQFKHDQTCEDSFNAGSGDAIPGRKLMKKDGGYWEADLGCSESTDVIQSAMESSERGKKRKYADDEEAPPNKNPRVEASYKFGPRNALPGKIKKALAFSVIVQDPVKKAEELFKPTFHEQSTIGGVVSQAGPKPFDFVESGDGYLVKPKPKPKPHPIKGKVSTSELSIVT